MDEIYALPLGEFAPGATPGRLEQELQLARDEAVLQQEREADHSGR